MSAEAEAPKPSILKVIDRFANRESTNGFIEDYEKYVKGAEGMPGPEDSEAKGLRSDSLGESMDGRARLRAEYALLLAEADGLSRSLHASDADGGEPSDPVRTGLLRRQLGALMGYLRILAERAALEGVSLDLGEGVPADFFPAYNKCAGTSCREERCSMKDVKDAKDVAEALKAIEGRLEAIERLMGDAVRMLGSIEAPRNAWGKGPVDAYGNPKPYC